MVVVEGESIDFIEDSSSSGRCFFNTCTVKRDSVESHCRFVQGRHKAYYLLSYGAVSEGRALERPC